MKMFFHRKSRYSIGHTPPAYLAGRIITRRIDVEKMHRRFGYGVVHCVVKIDRHFRARRHEYRRSR